MMAATMLLAASSMVTHWLTEVNHMDFEHQACTQDVHVINGAVGQRHV
jgi:hypothetical protein